MSKSCQVQPNPLALKNIRTSSGALGSRDHVLKSPNQSGMRKKSESASTCLKV